MAFPDRPASALRRILPVALLALLAAAPAHALRVVTWNLLDYVGGDGSVEYRQASARTVIAGLEPDILVTQEMNNAAARDSFLLNVLGVVEPGEWTSAYLDVTGEGMGLFWKPAVVSVSNIAAFATTTGPRKVLQSLVKPVGYVNKAGWFRLYSFHLKAGDTDSATRRLQCTEIRTTLNNVVQTVVGPNFLIGGDSNFYGSWEGGYIRLTESQADDDGRGRDYTPITGTWNSSSYARHHTQSACSYCPDQTGLVLPTVVDYSGGGMDDRFDLWLSSYTLQDSSGLDVVGYIPYGNDGLHFNQDINANPNLAVGYTIATALWTMSDHLPVVAVLQLPSKLAAASQLDFGPVITGATAGQTLAVTNIATVPGDSLRYSLAAPTGFTAAAGTFVLAAGSVTGEQTIGMDTGTAGPKSGTLTLASNDPDTSAKAVLLSGTVLRHAVASLDSLAVVTTDTLDFGELPPAAFTDQVVRVFDQGYDALQARLAVNDGVIAGGEGRFSIVGGFAATLVAGTPSSFAVHFDTTGVVNDSTYEATLTFTCADETLPGATAQPDLVVALRARAVDSNTSVPGGPPAAVRFYPPRPNPSPGAFHFAFDLPMTTAVQLDVYDLSGRRVAKLLSGLTEAGRHDLTWEPLGKTVAAGLYFVRFSIPGFTRTERIVTLP
jgi:endonuclease/exonuclease/phosphatase family metal-dependent hydrolase